MKKSTINRILISIIILLVVAIMILLICIVTRPRYTAEDEPQTAVITEIPASEAVIDTSGTQTATGDEPEPATGDTVLRGKTSTRVNIRELPSADSRVLETVEAGAEYEILEIMESGWVKIQYTDSLEAYISSSYVILLNE